MINKKFIFDKCEQIGANDGKQFAYYENEISNLEETIQDLRLKFESQTLKINSMKRKDKTLDLRSELDGQKCKSKQLENSIE